LKAKKPLFRPKMGLDHKDSEGVAVERAKKGAGGCSLRLGRKFGTEYRL
jgi:hypothetical protein